MTRWVAKYSLMRKRLYDAWMDLIEKPAENDPRLPGIEASLRASFAAEETERQREATLGGWAFEARQFNPYWAYRTLEQQDREAHARLFPFSDNLYAMMLLVQSELSPTERTWVTQTLTTRGVLAQNYTFEIVRELFISVLCVPRTSHADPYLRPRSDQQG